MRFARGCCVVIGLGLEWISLAACGGAPFEAGPEDKVLGDGGAGDAAAADGTAEGDSDALADDASGDGTSADSTLPPTVYNDLGSASFWSVFDTASLNANAQGFFGGAFDGRYVYLVPSSHTLATRYDTRAAFTIAGSWETFDTSAINTAMNVGYRGGAFDGRYVYLVPFYDSTANIGSGVVARFDSNASFADAASWATFDTSTVDLKAEGFDGATFDGRYLYFVPHLTGTVTRYDTQGGFGSASSWTTFDATMLDPNAAGFLGGVFDGRYVYLVPNGPSIPLTRYDTQMPFASGSAWSTFETTTADPSAQSFLGGAYDGQYVYLAPFPTGSTSTSTVALRYGPAGGLAASSFASFDTGEGFAGAALDGRFIYLAPDTSGVVRRYDSRRTFGAAGSWSAFDLSGISSTAKGYYGAVFDGRFMYFVPGTGTVARFDAKAPRSMPQLPGWNGSFL